ncbi:PGF-pre-PGF domain-containing protein [Nanohaloarchaea archaeon]|nr:PGF-pre-PGF domain-containing protein [Candidatus Nanohaloarchaea archaeon]
MSNATINSSKLRDGKHQVVVKAKDKAGNKANFTQTIFIDNTPPIISKTNIDDYENLSGTIDIEASFKDTSDIDLARFKLNNSSSNNTNWRTFNETVDTKKLSDGDYSLLIEVNDTLGNYKRTAIENITIDNTNPEINLTTYNISTKSKGWINNSKKVQVRCEDSLTGAKNISIGQKSSKSIPGNLTVTSNGNKSREFHCNDFSGNSISSSLRLAIDSKPPMVSDVIPSNRTKDLDRNFAVEISISREETGSGISPSNSSISVNKGEKEITWSNSSVVIKILETDYGDNVKIESQLRDRLGHKNNIELSYGIRQPPSDETFSGNSGSSTSSDSSGNHQDDNQNTNYSTGRTRQENISEKDNSSFNKTVGRLENNRSDNSKFRNNSGSVDFDQNLLDIGSESNKVSVSVEKPQEDISSPPETSKISRFNMEVNSTNHPKLNITFGINKSRIYRNETEGVYLFKRAKGNWKSLETMYLGLSDSQYTFASKVRDFSPFMIGVNKSQVGEVERDQDSRTKNNANEKLDETKSRLSYQSYNIYFWIAVSLVTVLVAILTRYREN